MANKKHSHSQTHQQKILFLFHLFGCWRKPENPHSYTYEEHANSTQKGPRPSINLQPSCCEATLPSAAPPQLFLFLTRNLLWRKAEHKHNLTHLLHHFFLAVFSVLLQLPRSFRSRSLAAFFTYLKLVLPWSCCSLLLILECWGFFNLPPPPHALHQAVPSSGSPPIAALPSPHYVV